jgi:hypothetical protein
MNFTASEVNRMREEYLTTGTVMFEDYYDSSGRLCRRMVPYEVWRCGNLEPAKEKSDPNKLFRERKK